MGGRRATDLTNQQFGSLIVIERDYGYPDKKHAYWKCKCKNCGNIKSIRSSHLVNKEIKTCSCVRDSRIHDLTNQQFGNWTVLERDMDYILKGSHTVYWKCRCKCGTIKSIRGDSLLSGNTISCGCIKFSKGEEKIKQILNYNNIKFETQKIFSDCKLIQVLRFDFYLPNYNTIIEYDGKQHYEKVNLQNDSNKKFNLIKQRDQIKNIYCKNNNIKLIRIPYTYYNNICLEDLLPQTSKFLIF